MTEDYEVLDNWGYTSTVYRLPGNPPRVCKSFNENCVKTHFPIEKQVYERFTANKNPPSILKYYGIHNSLRAGVILELAENKSLWLYLHDQILFERSAPEPKVLYQWAAQATEALAFAHSLGVYNADIHAANMFLDKDLNLKVGDWAGASIDGSVSQSSYRLKSRLFDENGRDIPRATGITVLTEIFALGTAFYFMVTGKEPWPELKQDDDDEEIKKRIREKEFPDTKLLPVLGEIILDCWNVKYSSMTDVRKAIEAEEVSKISSVD